VPKLLGAELSGHFGTSAEVSSGHFVTGAEVSWYRSVLGPKCPVTEFSSSGYGGRVFVIVNVIVHFLLLTILLTDFEF